MRRVELLAPERVRPVTTVEMPEPREGERDEPMRFVVESFSVYVLDAKGKESWAAEVVWDKADRCFTLEDVHNFTFAPCDLLELARILRTIPRELTAAATPRAPILSGEVNPPPRIVTPSAAVYRCTKPEGCCDCNPGTHCCQPATPTCEVRASPQPVGRDPE